MKEAMFYTQLKKGGGKKVQCQLCPHSCVIEEREVGKCRVRKNITGKLFSLVYNKPCTISLSDPIEKKPLYHFLPGAKTLSIATLGCNLFCLNCQNWNISQIEITDENIKEVTAKQVINIAKENNIKIIAYTYTEPTVFYEYMLDIMKLAKEKGIKNIIVSNGFINPLPLKKLLDKNLIDAANIDLKSMSSDFYKKICGVNAGVKPVLNTLKLLYKSGVHLEITNLLIPGKNDSEEEIKKLISWIKENTGTDTPMHFSAFYPSYKLSHIGRTSDFVIKKARKIAVDSGMKYVYTGNIIDNKGSSTYCFKCNNLLIKREGFKIIQKRIKSGRCKKCGERIYGVWE